MADPGPHAGEPLRIDYASVRHLEFGQKVSRRKPLVVAATVALGPVGLIALAARSRAHYLTVTYANDRDGADVVVIELGKHVVGLVLTAIEERAGTAIEFQDEEARKWSR